MRTQSPCIPPATIDPAWRIGIVISSYYKEEVDVLVEGATAFLCKVGIPAQNITRHDVPGSFEIPLIGAALAEAGQVDALIGIGIIVEGETGHAGLLARNAARGIMEVQLRYQMPFAFEVLLVEALEQARARAFCEHNKGEEAACAVLHSLAKLHSIRS